MSANTRNQTPPKEGYLRELIALGLIALATLLTLSLVSYDPLDDTLLYSNPSNPVTKNYIGPLGANTAAFLLQLAGFSTYLLPAVLFMIGGCLALRITVSAVFTKALGSAGLFMGSAIALSLYFPSLVIGEFVHPFPGGGLLGEILVGYLRSTLSDLAIYILCGLLMAVSLLLTIHFSLAAFFRGVGNFVVAAFSGFSRRREARAKVKKKEVAKKSSKPSVVVRVQLPFAGRRKKVSRREATGSRAGKPTTVEQASPPEEEVFQPVILRPKKRRRSRARAIDERLPSVSLLDDLQQSSNPLNLRMLTEQARVIVKRYQEFGIDGEVIQTNPGPVVHTFEFKPAPGVKYNRVVGLSDELCLALKAISVRINRLPGKSTIGIEVPNPSRELIRFREIVESHDFEHEKSPLVLALGKQINGDPYVANLCEMPHLLIAGATGTGKSVSIHTMICSILFKTPPDVVRFILIDPKQVELNHYNGIPHLLTPVVSSPKQAANALRWACEEMENRYRRLASEGARNIDQYNRIVAEAQQSNTSGDEENGDLEPLPYIVIAIDELADLMMVSSVDVEESICRLAQKARAVGIHLIVATQRPSVDVLTGVIKANFQCRISFRVATKVDSRTILDCNGAESLLGEGDMLFLPPRSSQLIRIHGSFLGEKEITRVIDFLRDDDGEVSEEGLLIPQAEESERSESLAPARDPLYDEAVSLVLSTGVASISNLQRKMRLGYARAARIIDMMEADGLIGPADGSKPRQILKKQLM